MRRVALVASLRWSPCREPGGRDRDPKSPSQGGATGRTRSRSSILRDPTKPFGQETACGSCRTRGRRENSPASPTGPWTAHTTRRPQAPQALLLVSLEGEGCKMSSVRTEEVEEDTAERRFAPISVHDRRNRCSPSSGTSVHHHRNTQTTTTTTWNACRGGGSWTPTGLTAEAAGVYCAHEAHKSCA